MKIAIFIALMALDIAVNAIFSNLLHAVVPSWPTSQIFGVSVVVTLWSIVAGFLAAIVKILID